MSKQLEQLFQLAWRIGEAKALGRDPAVIEGMELRKKQLIETESKAIGESLREMASDLNELDNL